MQRNKSIKHCLTQHIFKELYALMKFLIYEMFEIDFIKYLNSLILIVCL